MGRALSQPELENFCSLEWTEIAPRLAPAVRDALEKVLTGRDGSALTRKQCFRLANCDGDDLLGLLVAANELRAELAGNLVTYVVNRNINFTNICFVGCKFCAFSRGPRESDTYFLNLDQVARKATEAWEVGATEVCIQGGLPHGLPPFYYRDILRAVKYAVPRMHCHAFSPMEIIYGVELTGMSVADYLAMLRDNGLDTLPGTAAEILDDEVRAVLSRNKLSTDQWKEVITTAHRLGIRSTSTLMYGHVETPGHWVNQIRLLRDIQEQTGGFTEFVPLGFVHQNTLLFQQGLARSGPTLAEHLKIHALARVLLAGSINNIQVSWVKLNRKLSQLCLQAGANDYGGTLMEENISREAGATAGQYTSPEQFQALILEAGRIPAERNTTYSRIRIKLPLEDLTSEHAPAEEFA
ncbi:MAG TPA: 5-amino-6-(D-ribitylamino)uracil--L-tyrosine 4-hydroxyphenyl transferase CofH [Terriglobales bacterium]|nr:5-amino-6-(D-ribitylamino)uracil--L-tyrosine 4-hydroxyphenyl transferase CofH [Terriglobales bacterium]